MDGRYGNGGRRPLTPEERRRLLNRLTPEQKRRLLEKRRRRKMKKLMRIIVPVALILIIALVLILVLTGRGQTPDKVIDQQARQAMSQMNADYPAGQNSAAPVNVAAQADVAAPADDMNPADGSAAVAGTPMPTAAPAPTPEPRIMNYDEAYAATMGGKAAVSGRVVATDMNIVDPNKLSRWPAASEGMLPIVRSAATDEKIIAVTVDDVYQASNLRRIVQCALDNNADLTIFPVGENLTDPVYAEAIRWSWENGMEIENHTYNHVGLFHYDDKGMTDELWYQDRLIDEILGVDYQMHFFRPRGGDERNCQRVHAYVDQLGYSAIAMWNVGGSKSSISSLKNGLAPGNIYLFHTTDNDEELLLEFIPYAVQQGYTLVTLNDMFGLPVNETAPLTPNPVKPEFEYFQIQPVQLSKTTYSRASYVVQKRLIELGWLEGEADGVYGADSYKAVGFFQMAAGLEADGVAGAETQRILFSDNAPRGSAQIISDLKKQN